MPTSSLGTLGEAFVEVRVRLDKMERDLERARTRTQTATKKMESGFAKVRNVISGAKGLQAGIVGFALALGAGQVKQAFDQTLNRLDSLDKASNRLGVSTDALQAWGFAAEQAGINSRTLELSVQRFVRRAGEAATGTGEAKAALAELGFTMEELRTQSPEQLFERAIVALDGVGNASQKLRLAFKLFDSEGAALVQVTDRFVELTGKAREMGIIVEASVIQRAVEAKDELGALHTVMQAQLAPILVELAPLFFAAGKALASVATEMRDFAEAAGIIEKSSTARQIAKITEEIADLEAHLAVLREPDDSIFGFLTDRNEEGTGAFATKIRTIERQIEIADAKRLELEAALSFEEKERVKPPAGTFDAAGEAERLKAEEAAAKEYQQRLEELRRIVESGKTEVQQLTELLARLNEESGAAKAADQQLYADAISTTALQLQSAKDAAAAAALALEEANAATSLTNSLALDAGRSLSNSFVSAFRNLGSGAKSAKQAFKEFGATVAAEVTVLIAKLALLRAFGVAFSPAGGGGFAGAFAAGGVIGPGQFGVVGERGPEIATAGSQPLRITPLASGGRTTTPSVIINNNGQPVEVQSVRQGRDGHTIEIEIINFMRQALRSGELDNEMGLFGNGRLV